MKDRIRASNPGQSIASAILDSSVENNYTALSVFHFGQVISVSDDKNSNRIKVRIPLLDNSLYYNEKGQLEDNSGDDKLSWCIPAFGRFIETPEINSVVLVALLDPTSPFSGRVWFSAIKSMSSSDLFSELKGEIEGEDAWALVEQALEIKREQFPNEKGNKINKKKSAVNFKLGIRGKSNNKLLFDEKETTLIQDEGKDSESKLVLSKLVLLKGKNIDILSSSSTKEHRPVFADPLFDYLTNIHNILMQIATLLLSPGSISVPSPGAPIAPSTSAPNILSKVISEQLTLEKLKINGKSKYIKIN